MNQETADYVRGKAKVVAVSDAFRLAPWADFLVSNDRKWWEANPEAYLFKGRKFCSHPLNKAESFRKHVHMGRNSGLMGMCLAKDLGAKRILLCGFDMHGTHFFGEHGHGLKNTTEKIFKVHVRQFDRFSGCNVVNCTAGSRLLKFPFGNLYDLI